MEGRTSRSTTCGKISYYCTSGWWLVTTQNRPNKLFAAIFIKIGFGLWNAQAQSFEFHKRAAFYSREARRAPQAVADYFEFVWFNFSVLSLSRHGQRTERRRTEGGRRDKYLSAPSAGSLVPSRRRRVYLGTGSLARHLVIPT